MSTATVAVAGTAETGAEHEMKVMPASMSQTGRVSQEVQVCL